MSLPQGKIGRATVELSGGTVEVHSLTLAQSRIVGNLAGDERMVAAIAFGTSTPKDEVEAWVESDNTPAEDAMKLLNAIADASGLSVDAQFQE